MKRLVWGVAVVLAVSSVTIRANDDKKSSSALTTAITKAADNLMARQQTLANGDAGSGTMPCAWEWDLGSGKAYANTQSPAARGLLAAYGATGKKKYLNGARCAADQLVARLDATTKRPYSEDVLFLMGMSEATGDSSYARRAVAYHKRTRRDFTAVQLTDYYISTRQSLAGWGVASQIDAALAVEQEDYAQAVAERLVQQRTNWEGVLFSGWDYSPFSRAALVGSLKDLEGKTIKKYRDEIRQSTLSAQGTDGSWGDADVQFTAFALAGLASAPKSSLVRDGIAAGVKYVLTTQSASGAFIDTYGENTEVNGEVLSALCLLVRNQSEDDHDQ